MPRRRNVPIKKGRKRIRDSKGDLEIVQTYFCGECGRRLKTATTQKPHTSIAQSCENIEGHKTSKIYLWVLKGVEMVGTSN